MRECQFSQKYAKAYFSIKKYKIFLKKHLTNVNEWYNITNMNGEHCLCLTKINAITKFMKLFTYFNNWVKTNHIKIANYN